MKPMILAVCRRVRLAVLAGVASLGLLGPPGASAWEPLFRSPDLYDIGTWLPNSTVRGGGASGIASGDLNEDGLPDLVVSIPRTPAQHDTGTTVTVLLQSSYDAPLFRPKASYSTVRYPLGVAIADLDKDGHQDVVTASEPTYPGAEIGVLRGTGTGSLKPPERYPIFARVLLGASDLNQDTWPDVVVATDSAGTTGVSVLLGTGQGVLGAPRYTPGSSTGGTARILGDATGDGILDVVVVGGSWIRVMQGNNTGSFPTILAPYELGHPCHGAALGYLNADAIPDLAVGLIPNPPLSPQVAVLIGTGSGGFEPPVLYSVFSYPRTMRVGDVNADGLQDIVAVDFFEAFSSFNVTLLPGLGGGTFGPPHAYSTAPGGYAVLLADLDNDDRADLATAGPNPNLLTAAHTVSVLRGEDMGFVPPIESMIPGVSFQETFPRRQTLADFNHDGNADVAMCLSSSISIGAGAGGFFSLPVATINTGYEPWTVLAGDVDQIRNGLPDLIVGDQGQNLARYDNVGDWTFVGPTWVRANAGVTFPRSLADMNRDGRLDIVVASSGGLKILIADALGDFVPSTATFLGTDVRDLVIGDWNRDGIHDAAVATPTGIHTLLGSGTGFSASTALIVGRSYTAICAEDFNRDGRLDIAGREDATGLGPQRGIDIFLAQIDGTFSLTRTLPTLEHRGYSIDSWDVNVDGKPDLIAHNVSDLTGSPYDLTSMDGYVGNGSGTFPFRMSYPIGRSNFHRGLASADLNGDDVRDVVGPSPSIEGMTLKAILAAPPDQEHGLQPKTSYPMQPGTMRVALGDLNRDGKLDVVSAAGWFTPGLAVRLGTGSGALGPSTTLTQSLGATQIELADFNRDGILDIVSGAVVQGPPEVISCMLGIGNGTFGPRIDHAIPGVTHLAVADMDRDGILDLVVGQAGITTIRVLRGLGNGAFTALAPITTPGFVDLDTLDMGGDGIPDVVAAGGSDLFLLYGYGNGTMYSVPPISMAPMNLISLCVRDFDRDGRPDVAVTDANTFQVAVARGSAIPPLSLWSTSPTPGIGGDVHAGAAEADGRSFLYMINGEGLSLLEPVSPHTFTFAGTHPIQYAEALALGDMDRDGLLDVVTAGGLNGEVSVFLHGPSTVTGTEVLPVVPPAARLDQNFPNPFNPSTTLRYSLRESGRVRLAVFDVQGRLVTDLVDGHVPAGDHTVEWGGRTREGSVAASGVYFYRLTTESGYRLSRRMVMLK